MWSGCKLVEEVGDRALAVPNTTVSEHGLLWSGELALLSCHVTFKICVRVRVCVRVFVSVCGGGGGGGIVCMRVCVCVCRGGGDCV